MPNSIKYSTTGDTQSLRDGNFYIGTGDVGKGPTSTTGHWNGITPPGGGYTVYKNKVSNGPAIWTATSDNQLISLTNNTEGTSFTTAQQCLNYYATQTDKMVFNKDYEGIVTSGLTVCLDAGFIPSYQGSGTTWYDLSYSGNNGTLANGPTFSIDGGGSIVFDSTDDEVNTSYGPTLGNFTIGIWFKDNGTPQYGRLVDKSYTGGFWLGRNDTTPNSWGGGIMETSFPYGIFVTLTDGQWNYLTSIRSGTTHILYGNGITNTTSNTVTSSALDSTTISIGAWSGPENSQRFKGNIGVVQVYNRALSATEVLQNYNAGLARFNTSNVVKSGLVLNLDASNTVSYPTSGTTWLDLSGYGNKGTLTNGPTFDSTSKSIVFDGTNDYVQVTSPFGDIDWSSRSWSFSALMKLDVMGDRCLVNLNSANSSHYVVTNVFYGGYSYWYFIKNSTPTQTNFTQTSANFTTNEIFHFTMTYNGNGLSNGNISFYKNGTLLTTTGGGSAGLSNQSGLQIGGNYFLDGNVSNFLMWNRAITASEVMQNYYQAPIVTSGLVMALDTGNLVSYSGSGTSWRDLTTNGNNCTLTNGPTFNSSNGGSIVFDGTDDYIGGPTLATNSPLSFTNGNFTLEHWIRITSYEPSGYFGLTNMIMSKGPASTYNYATQVTNSTTLSFIHRDNSEGLIFLNFTVPTITNNITQIVFSITLTQVSLYLNGILIETKSLTGNPITPYTNDVLLIGGLYNTSNTNFTGNMYLHRIYNRPLTADEVAQNFNAYKTRFGL